MGQSTCNLKENEGQRTLSVHYCFGSCRCEQYLEHIQHKLVTHSIHLRLTYHMRGDTRLLLSQVVLAVPFNVFLEPNNECNQ